MGVGYEARARSVSAPVTSPDLHPACAASPPPLLQGQLRLGTVSQETFDQVVRENVEDFEMEWEEAVADAILQLKSQGAQVHESQFDTDQERIMGRLELKREEAKKDAI